MSENKYIIDKDSLTGIADAVRNKLGNGEAITDENAGYYPVPSLVGVKAPNITVVLNTGSPNAIQFGLNLEESPYESLYGNNPFSKVEIFGSYFESGLYKSQVRMDINSTTCTMTYNSTKKTFSATCSFGSPQNTFLLIGATSGSISVSYSDSRSFTFSAMHFILKDANDNVILPKLENLPVTWNLYRSASTWTVGTGDMYYQDVATPIPFTIDDIQDKITNYLGKKSGLIYRYHINPQNNESGTAFAGFPLSKMNVLDYGVTSVSQIKFMLIYGQYNSSSFTWSPGTKAYTIIINGKIFRINRGYDRWPNESWDDQNPSYSLHLCDSKNSTWPLGIMLGTSSGYNSDDTLQYPRIVFMVLDLEATE